jgi:hypothetical protein
MPEFKIVYRRFPQIVQWTVCHADPAEPWTPRCTNGAESNMRKARKAAEHALRMANRTPIEKEDE